MKLGLMQGRLLPPVRGQMREFPENWEDELVLVERLGLVGVEWLLTLYKFHDNPILEKNTFNKFPVMSVCMDNLVDDQIHDPLILKNIIQLCYDAGVRRFTIPLLEQSSMINGEKRNHFWPGSPRPVPGPAPAGPPYGRRTMIVLTGCEGPLIWLL